MPEPADPLIDRVFDGRYRVVRVLGQGAMGTVYVALQLSTDLDRALKVVRAEYVDTPKRIARSAREAEIVKRLRDPHTVQLLDQGRLDDGRPYLVSELLEGETLGARLRRGPLSVDETLAVMAAVCNSLGEAHARGIVHRDLKPENIFVAALGHREVIKVLDFGVARFAEASTTTGNVVGTAAYMAPEQALAQPVDGRADLYALGVVAFECLSGQRPFRADRAAVMLHLHAFTDPPPLAPLAPDAPPALVEVVMRLLRKAPDERYPDAATLGAAVDALRRAPRVAAMAPIEVDATTTMDPAAPSAALAPTDPASDLPPSPTHRARRAVGLGLALLAAGGAVWWLADGASTRAVEATDLGPVDARVADVIAADVITEGAATGGREADVGRVGGTPSDVGPAEAGPADVGPADVGPADAIKDSRVEQPTETRPSRGSKRGSRRGRIPPPHPARDARPPRDAAPAEPPDAAPPPTTPAKTSPLFLDLGL